MKCFVSDLEKMDSVEFERWQFYYDRKMRMEQDAIEKSKRQTSPRRR